MTFKDWARRHSTLFGFNSRAAAGTVLAWAREFRRLGYTPEQLDAATTRLFEAGKGAKYPADQLEALQAALDAIRRPQTTQTPPGPSERVCGDCRGSGLASVPNPRAIESEKWSTLAVVCRCEAARRLPASLLKRRPLTLDEYERDHPHWREVLRQHAESVRVRKLERSDRKLIDGAISSVVDRLKRDARN